MKSIQLVSIFLVKLFHAMGGGGAEGTERRGQSSSDTHTADRELSFLGFFFSRASLKSRAALSMPSSSLILSRP